MCGPNVNAAAILSGIEGDVPAERTALLMETLLGAPVSTGFIARALAEDVLCVDEIPTNVVGWPGESHRLFAIADLTYLRQPDELRPETLLRDS